MLAAVLLLPVVSTALIILSLLNKILAHRVLVGIDLVSFSAYLWHQPLYAFTRIFTRGTN